MQVFVARQPIFDRLRRVIAYELLFRTSLENKFTGADGDTASKSVVSSGLYIFGFSSLTGGKPAFINFTKPLLTGGLVHGLSPKQVVIELLETVEPDEEVLSVCRDLKSKGYIIALDDFFLRPGYEPLIELADIVKIDFLQVKGKERKLMVQSLAGKKVRLLAEKVETNRDFLEALQAGYSYFQGFFFCKPEIVFGREVPLYRLTYLRLMQQLSREELDFNQLEGILKGDASLSFKLLRYINSAAIGLRYPVTSLRQAMVVLGEQNLRRWAILTLVVSMLEDKPQELLVTGAVRGRFCELICQRLSLQAIGVDPFLVGLFSILDVLLDRPLTEILDELPIAHEIKDALLGRPTLLGLVHKLVIAYERADWDGVSDLAERIKLPEEELPTLYAEAVSWADQFFHAVTTAFGSMPSIGSSQR
ncbi:MAG: EAL and HDOD domain-containing protein [Armatimonadota bacterium]